MFSTYDVEFSHMMSSFQALTSQTFPTLIDVGDFIRKFVNAVKKGFMMLMTAIVTLFKLITESPTGDYELLKPETKLSKESLDHIPMIYLGETK